MPFPLGAAIGAAGSVLGSLIGGVTSSAAQRRANATNIQIARETNAQNYRIFQEQQQFNENQFNRWLDYSTPAAQRQRYEDAGINPYGCWTASKWNSVQFSYLCQFCAYARNTSTACTWFR